MSRSGRVVRTEKKWTVVNYDFFFSEGGSVTALLPMAHGRDLNSAEELDTSTNYVEGWERMNRMLGAFTVNPGPQGANAGPNGAILGVGLYRGRADAVVIPSPTSALFSDGSWVYRAYYALPSNLKIQDVDPGLCRFDWPLRGGRGTNIDRDVELQLVATLSGAVIAPGGSVTVRWMCLGLGESSP